MSPDTAPGPLPDAEPAATSGAAAGATPGVRPVADAAGLEAAGWNGLLGVEDFFQTPRWLTVQERNSGTTMDFLVRDRGGAPVAGLVTAWADTSVAWLLARPDAMLKRAVEQEVPEARELLHDLADGDPATLLPSLVCGGRHLGRTRTLATPDATEADVEALLEGAEGLAAERGRPPCASRTWTCATPDSWPCWRAAGTATTPPTTTPGWTSRPAGTTSSSRR